MQLEPITRATKTVGQDDVCARVDKAAVQRSDAIGMLEIPQLRRITRDQADVEQVAAGGPVGEQPRTGRE